MATPPTIGRIVSYTLSEQDAEAINRRRKDARKLNAAGVTLASQNLGAQIHTGNSVTEGDVYPLIITRVWGADATSPINGQLLLDGNDVLWVTSVPQGTGPRTWAWPVKF